MNRAEGQKKGMVMYSLKSLFSPSLVCILTHDIDGVLPPPPLSFSPFPFHFDLFLVRGWFNVLVKLLHL